MSDRIITVLWKYSIPAIALFQAIGAAITAFVMMIKEAVEVFQISYNKNKQNAEAELILTKARSIEVHDELSVIEGMKQLMQQGLVLEKLLQEKNDIIAEHENEEYELKLQIEDLQNQVRAYERQINGIKSKNLQKKSVNE